MCKTTILDTPHYLTKSFWCMGKALTKCLGCRYCRLLDCSTHGLEVTTTPSFVDPRLDSIPVAINLFYGDPTLQVENTLSHLAALEKSNHKGPVVIISKGDFSWFDNMDYNLDIHLAFSTFGRDHPMDGGSWNQFMMNLAYARRKFPKYKMSIEYRPIICGVNDTHEDIFRVMQAAGSFGIPVGFSGLQAKPQVQEYWAAHGDHFQQYPGYALGFKKYLAQDIVDMIYSFKIPVFPRTSCLISWSHGMERDYNAHYYRPNEVGCGRCPMVEKCRVFYQGLSDKTYTGNVPFFHKKTFSSKRTCAWYHKGCTSQTADCTNLNGWFIEVPNQKLTTSDVRMIKWLTGMTVINDFWDSPYISEDWVDEFYDRY